MGVATRGRWDVRPRSLRDGFCECRGAWIVSIEAHPARTRRPSSAAGWSWRRTVPARAYRLAQGSRPVVQARNRSGRHLVWPISGSAARVELTFVSAHELGTLRGDGDAACAYVLEVGGRWGFPVARWDGQRRPCVHRSLRRRCSCGRHGGGIGSWSDEEIENGAYASVEASAGAMAAFSRARRGGEESNGAAEATMPAQAPLRWCWEIRGGGWVVGGAMLVRALTAVEGEVHCGGEWHRRRRCSGMAHPSDCVDEPCWARGGLYLCGRQRLDPGGKLDERACCERQACEQQRPRRGHRAVVGL